MVHPTIWHNTLTSQTGRTGRQRSNSIGRTVLQTVAQKYYTKIILSAQSQIGVTPECGICILAIGLVGLPHPFRSNLTPAYVVRTTKSLSNQMINHTLPLRPVEVSINLLVSHLELRMESHVSSESSIHSLKKRILKLHFRILTMLPYVV